jgi:ubiquinone/menaquinone biosynthesis C-methylase UbiE
MSFDPIAPVYDATRTFDEASFNAALDYIVARFPPQKYPALFEPGIGTGRIAIPLAERGYSVTGADISGEMLKVLTDKLARRRPPLPVNFLQHDITSLPFPDASFDIAIGVHIFHLIRPWKKAMDEVFRVLKPGAPLILMFTGIGLEAPDIKERYRALCAEYGYAVRHIGMQTDKDLPEYLSAAGRKIEWIRGRWQWTQSVRVDNAFNDIGRKFYSTSQHVPDDVHRQVMDKLEVELKQQYGDLAVAVEIPTEIAVGLILPA